MLKNVFGILLFIFSVASVASTEAIDYELMFNNCTKNSEGPITGKLVVCSESVSKKIDIEIEVLSNQVKSKLANTENGNAKKAVSSFNVAQQSWLKYKKLQCELAGEYVGSPMYTYCPMKLGIIRVKELREFVQ